MKTGQRSVRRWIIGWLLIVGLVGACAPSTPEGAAQALLSPLARETAAPQITAPQNPQFTATWVPTLTPLPTATPRPTPSPSQLVVLHTNDNWGETEPCG